MSFTSPGIVKANTVSTPKRMRCAQEVQCHNGVKCKSGKQTLSGCGWHAIEEYITVSRWHCEDCSAIEAQKEQALKAGRRRLK